MIDTHSGINEETLLSITLSDLLLIVLQPDQQDFQGTAVTIDVARKLNVPHLLAIINKASSNFDVEQLQQQVEETYEIDVAGVLLHSDKMMLLGSKGLFTVNYPTDRLTQTIEEIAKQIVNL